MIVDVRLTQVLMLRVLVRQMGMGHCRMIVFVRVLRCEVLPFAQHFVGALAPVVRDMRVLVLVHNRLVRVLLEVPQVSMLRHLECQG